MKLADSLSRLRLGLACMSPNDARSLSRQAGPFSAMTRQDPRLELVYPRANPTGAGVLLDWDFFVQCDVVHFLDPVTEEDLARVALARTCGARVWVDYIDDVFSVRRSNPNHLHYANASRIQSLVASALQLADIVTTTTETLRNRLPDPNRVVVLPESCRWPAHTGARRKIVTWRGMASHDEDASSVAAQVADVARLPQFSRWDWLFMGDVPWRLQEAIPVERLIVAPVAPPFAWFQMWASHAPFLHLVPLPDNPFNRSKTPLAWLEATAAGAAVIGPRLPEWNDCEGLIQYSDPADFGVKLRQTMEQWNNGALHPAAVTSQAAVYPARTLERVNEYRWVILNKLTSTKSKENHAQVH